MVSHCIDCTLTQPGAVQYCVVHCAPCNALQFGLVVPCRGLQCSLVVPCIAVWWCRAPCLVVQCREVHCRGAVPWWWNLPMDSLSEQGIKHTHPPSPLPVITFPAISFSKHSTLHFQSKSHLNSLEITPKEISQQSEQLDKLRGFLCYQKLKEKENRVRITNKKFFSHIFTKNEVKIKKEEILTFYHFWPSLPYLNLLNLSQNIGLQEAVAK